MRGGMNLLVIIAVGVILADMINNWQGTQALFNGVSGMWMTSVNGMLGKPTTGGTTGTAAGKTTTV